LAKVIHLRRTDTGLNSGSGGTYAGARGGFRILHHFRQRLGGDVLYGLEVTGGLRPDRGAGLGGPQ